MPKGRLCKGAKLTDESRVCFTTKFAGRWS